MAYDFSNFKNKIKETEEWLKKEFSGIRTGRATPAILDSVSVESYGARMAINQVAAISIEDARTIRISPWDVTQIKSIEKAISTSDLGLSTSVDEKGVRLFFPELTSERRTALIKIAKEKLETARVSLRKERDECWNDIQAKEKKGGMGEDEKFRHKDEMQKLIDEGNKKLEEAFNKKEKEISS